MKAVLSKQLADRDADQVRRSHADAIRELQVAPASSMRVLRDVQLPNGVEVPIAHKLGRAPAWVKESAPRGAATTGLVRDMGSVTAAGVPIDRAQRIVLRADGYGATITVDVMVL